MLKKARCLIGICVLVLFLTGCGSWYRISEIRTQDSGSEEFLSIPLHERYGVHTLSTSFVSNSNPEALAERIQNASTETVRYTVKEYASGSLLICIYTQEELSAMLRIASQSPAKLDSPYSGYPYAYWFTNMAAEIDGKVEIPFPFHLFSDMVESSLEASVEYKTDYALTDFVDFYKEYCECYQIDPGRAVVNKNQLVLTKELLHRGEGRKTPEEVTLIFSEGKVTIESTG